MKSLMIKDLEISKELTRDDLSAVRGGYAVLTGFQQANGSGSGGLIGLGVGGTNTNTNVDASTSVALDLTNITQAFNVNPVAIKV